MSRGLPQRVGPTPFELETENGNRNSKITFSNLTPRHTICSALVLVMIYTICFNCCTNYCACSLDNAFVCV